MLTRFERFYSFFAFPNFEVKFCFNAVLPSKYFLHKVRLASYTKRMKYKSPELAKKGRGHRRGKTVACNGEHMKYVNEAFTLVNAKRSKEMFSLS